MLIKIFKFLFLSRLRRSGFWWQFLLCNFSAIAVSNLSIVQEHIILTYLSWPIITILTVYQMSLLIRRCHDADISWLLTVLILVLSILPLVSLMLYFMLLYKKSTLGWNKFGAEPDDGRVALSNN